MSNNIPINAVRVLSVSTDDGNPNTTDGLGTSNSLPIGAVKVSDIRPGILSQVQTSTCNIQEEIQLPSNAIRLLNLSSSKLGNIIPGIPVSSMPSMTGSLNGTEYLMIVQDNINKKITIQKLFSDLNITSLEGLDDVNISNLSEGDILIYSTSGWENKNIIKGSFDLNTSSTSYLVTDSRIKTGDHITCTISSLNITDDIIICQVAAINDGEFTVILSNCPDVPGYKVNWVVNI